MIEVVISNYFLTDIMNIAKAIQKVKQVGPNIYTSRSRNTGFIKVYLEPVMYLMPKLSGNAFKVLITLSYGLQWNEVEVIFTRAEIKKLTGLNSKIVKASLDELENFSIIKRLGPNFRTTYMINNRYIRLGKNK